MIKISSHIFRFVRQALNLIFVCIDGMVSVFNKPLTNKNTLMLVRLDAIGDFFVWLNSAQEYRNIYPSHKITLFANSTWADFAKTLDYWDEVVSVDINLFLKNYKYRWWLILKVRLLGFELAIQPTYSRSMMLGDSLVRASDAPTRIGSVGDLSNMRGVDYWLTKSWYTQLHESHGSRVTEHERNAEFTSILAKRYVKKQVAFVVKKSQSKFDICNKYVVLFPGASWDKRKWSAEKFSQLAIRLIENYGFQIVLCGSKQEHEICEYIKSKIGRDVANLAGFTTLSDLVEVIRNADLLVSNETSAVHIAAAVNTQSVCIIGGGHYGRFLPYSENTAGVKPFVANVSLSCYGCNWKCIKIILKNEPVLCISSITVDQVWEKCILALNLVGKKF